MSARSRKILAGTALVLIVVVALGLAVRAILNYTTGKRLESEVKRQKAEGKLLSLRDFTPRCRDVDNAALIWKGIEAMFIKDFDAQAVIHAPWKSVVEGTPLDPPTRARLEEAIGKYRSLFPLIREAATKPCFRYARRWGNVSFNLQYIDLKKLEPLFMLFFFDALFQAEGGGHERAIQDCRAAIRNTAFFMREPHPFNRSFRWLLIQKELVALRTLLSLGGADAQACQDILAELGELRPGESLLREYQLERAMILEEYASYIQGRVRGDLFERASLWLFRPKYKAEALYILKQWDEAEKVLGRPYLDQQEWINRALKDSHKIPAAFDLAHVFLPPLQAWAIKRSASVEAMIAVTRVGLACRIHFLRHGRIPPSLDGLDADILSQVPRDPFSGRALIYRQTPSGSTIYSVGPNRKDDGGRGAWEFGAVTDDDIAYAQEFSR